MASFLYAHIHDMHLQIMMIMSLPKKNNKQGERKLLNNVWGEVPPGEISAPEVSVSRTSLITKLWVTKEGGDRGREVSLSLSLPVVHLGWVNSLKSVLTKTPKTTTLL